MVTGVVPSPPRFLPSIFIAHRVQQSHCSSIFHRVLLTHVLALCGSQFVHKKSLTYGFLYENALGGTRTHEIDLYQAGGQPGTPPRRPATVYSRHVTRIIREVYVYVFNTFYYINNRLFCFLLLFILRRMGKHKASAHHTSTYFHTRVSI